MTKIGDKIRYDNYAVMVENISPKGDAYFVNTNDVGRIWISVDFAFNLKSIDRKEKIQKILK